MLAVERHVLYPADRLRLRRAQGKTAVIGPPGRGKTALLAELASRDEFVAITVPHGADQVERTILDLGAALGAGARDAAAAALESNLADPQPALDVLTAALGARRLIVDDFDLAQRQFDSPELSDLMTPSRWSLAQWLSAHAAVLSTWHSRPADFEPLYLDLANATAPWQIEGHDRETSALWQATAHEPETYRLALSYFLVTGAFPTEEDLRDIEALATATWAAVPESVCEVMALLSSYDAPFSKPTFELLLDRLQDGSWALDYARDNLLIEAGPTSYWLSPRWHSMVPQLIEGRARRQTHHRRLASFFAELTRSTAVDPRWIQAAHRHYVRAGECRKAMEFVRFGVALLLEAGRRASIDGGHLLAIDYYSSVLDLDDRLRRLDPTHAGVGPRNRGYAQHYYHYNRYKANLEDIDQTEAGYARSVEDYPENALFWSRLIVARMQRGRWEEALATHKRAYDKVQNESAREKHLLGRTVLKLVERNLDNAAIVIWGDTPRAREDKAEEARYRLVQRGLQGWHAEVLSVPPLPDTYFERAVRVEFKPEGERFRCRIKDCRVDGTGPSMLAALRTALETLRAELADLGRTPADVLTPQQRMRKRELSNIVDVLESEIHGRGPMHRWYSGHLRRRGERLVFVPFGGIDEIDEYYEIDDSIALPADPGDGLFEAKVKTGRSGVPVGPVVELEALGGPDRGRWEELNQQWRR
ncbi:MAG: hypothetical protein HC927_04025 [Deltaproteobacteria bacterium]|nr:hypothetical protein [Deltaproteobacteria bacterium]